ncbi:unnamed protein product [Hyaloperonospora brassicae]|uniref:Elicitor-like transglutaminase n=1 Tax=Hyaloperonospora brassicae TaxID=162125 RepID=A0AAV0UT26_HYABA|nr:unnamed protein product [Hyaloperonospora brassicae]
MPQRVSPCSKSLAPWLAASTAIALALTSRSAVRGEAISDAIGTPRGQRSTATLTHSHPAFGGPQRVTDVDRTRRASARQLEPDLSDVARLEEFFGTAMEMNFHVLTNTYARAACDKVPWAGHYWPTYEDGINAVWRANELSPAEKYAAAFHLPVDAFLAQLSQSSGVLSETSSAGASAASCRTDADCTALQDNDDDDDDDDDGDRRCGLHGNATSGSCIPTWHGLCHARAAAAILEDEPQCAVDKNNVTFHAVDIKALLTQLYDGAEVQVVFTGTRFNGPDGSGPELDRYGRYTNAAQKDVNPAIFHVAMANIVGKHRQSFIVDVSTNAAVSNEPVQGYELLEASIVDATTLSREHFDSDTYPFNPAATFVAKCTTRLLWTAESMEDDDAMAAAGRIDAYTVHEDYEYCLELDEDYTIIGGEWLGASRKNHPDFLWIPAGKPRHDTVTDTGISYANVLELVRASRQCSKATKSEEAAMPPMAAMPDSEYHMSSFDSRKRPDKVFHSQTKPLVSQTPETHDQWTHEPKKHEQRTDSSETGSHGAHQQWTHEPKKHEQRTDPSETGSHGAHQQWTHEPKKREQRTDSSETGSHGAYDQWTGSASSQSPHVTDSAKHWNQSLHQHTSALLQWVRRLGDIALWW